MPFVFRSCLGTRVVSTTGVSLTPSSNRAGVEVSSTFPPDCSTVEVSDTQVSSASMLSPSAMALVPATSSSDNVPVGSGLLDNSVDPELPSVVGSNAPFSTTVDWDLSEAFDWFSESIISNS